MVKKIAEMDISADWWRLERQRMQQAALSLPKYAPTAAEGAERVVYRLQGAYSAAGGHIDDVLRIIEGQRQRK
eukprot:COSAG01_NODE_22643_length_846_cov_1.199198_3_plen_73_part_00